MNITIQTSNIDDDQTIISALTMQYVYQ